MNISTTQTRKKLSRNAFSPASIKHIRAAGLEFFQQVLFASFLNDLRQTGWTLFYCQLPTTTSTHFSHTYFTVPFWGTPPYIPSSIFIPAPICCFFPLYFSSTTILPPGKVSHPSKHSTIVLSGTISKYGIIGCCWQSPSSPQCLCDRKRA